MKTFKKVLAILLAAMLLLSLAACSGSEVKTAEPEAKADAAEAQEAPAAKPLRIGFALNTLNTNAAFIDAHAMVQERCKENGWELMSMDTQSDPAILTSTIENFISAECDVIIAQFNNTELATGLLPAIKESGAVFGSYDVVIEDATYNLLSDNYELGKIIGREGGKWLKENFDGKGEVAICSVDVHEAIKLRGDGINDGFLEVCPDAQIVQRFGRIATPEQGITAGENLLQSNPNVKVVMGINDGGMLGVYEAFKAAGLNDASSNLMLIGCDGSVDGLNAIKDGGIYRATVSLNIAEEIADFVVRCAEYAQTGELDEENVIRYFPMTPIYLDNIDEK